MDNDSSSTSKILYIAKDGGESHIASTDVVDSTAPSSAVETLSVEDASSGGGHADSGHADSVSSSDEIIVGGNADSEEPIFMEGGKAKDEDQKENQYVTKLPKHIMPPYYYMDNIDMASCSDKGSKKEENSDDESSLCSDDIYAVDPMCARLKRFLESKNNEPMIDILTDIRDQLVLLNEKFNNKKE